MLSSIATYNRAFYLTSVKLWLVGKELARQFSELKKGKYRNGKTGLNPSKDVRRSQRYLIKQKRKTLEVQIFCNIKLKDLQLKLSRSKATSTTVQDVHTS